MRVRIIKEVIDKESCIQSDGEKGNYVAKTSRGNMCYKTSREAYGVHNNLKEAKIDGVDISSEEAKMLLANVDIKNASTILKGMGYSLIDFISQGMGGAIVKAVTPKQKEVAIKILDASEPLAGHEVAIYNKIEKIRKKRKEVRKHFPKIFKTFSDKEKKYVFIVMELLKSDSAATGVISNLFGGAEISNLDEPYADVAARARGQDIPIISSDLSKRALMLLSNSGKRREILENVVFSFGALGVDLGDLLKDLEKGASKLKLSLTENINNLIGNEKIYKALMGDLSGHAKNYVIFILNSISNAFHENLSGSNEQKEQKKKNFKKDIIKATEYLQRLFRTKPPVKLEYTNAPTDYEISQAPESAQSILKAIQTVGKQGIILSDIHDANVLIRPGTDEIVIVDVGGFSKKGDSGSIKNKADLKKALKNRKKRKEDIIRQHRLENQPEEDDFYGFYDYSPQVEPQQEDPNIDWGSQEDEGTLRKPNKEDDDGTLRKPAKNPWHSGRFEENKKKMRKIKVFIGKR